MGFLSRPNRPSHSLSDCPSNSRVTLYTASTLLLPSNPLHRSRANSTASCHSLAFRRRIGLKALLLFTVKVGNSWLLAVVAIVAVGGGGGSIASIRSDPVPVVARSASNVSRTDCRCLDGTSSQRVVPANSHRSCQKRRFPTALAPRGRAPNPQTSADPQSPPHPWHKARVTRRR